MRRPGQVIVVGLQSEESHPRRLYFTKNTDKDVRSGDDPNELLPSLPYDGNDPSREMLNPFEW